MHSDTHPSPARVRLDRMPTEVMQDFILKYLPKEALGKLALTSRFFSTECKRELEFRRAKKLLTHVILGEEAAALKIIEENPLLLLIKSKAEDYSGRMIEGTAFQAALGAHDTRMVEKILPWFAGLKEGEARRQYDEVFPIGVKASMAENRLNAYDFTNLVNTIITGKNVEVELIKFRETMTRHKHIKNLPPFNMHNLVNSYEAYVTHFTALANWTNRNLFWVKVIGFVQRQIPANYAQAHCSGLQRINDDYRAFKRTLDLAYSGRTFFPIDSYWGLGFDFGCTYSSVRELVPRVGVKQLSLGLKNHVQQKRAILQRLEASFTQHMAVNPGSDTSSPIFQLAC